MRAYRNGHLVYIPIYKNAATSYEILFGKILNWEIILTETIDWDNDTVFAHITHPYTRHLKGTIQFLYQHNLTSVIDDPRFNRFLISGYFDHHSYPLTQMFGDKVWKINWLPLDHPTISGDTITCCFLNKQGVEISEHLTPYKNIGGLAKKSLLDRIKILCEENDHTNDGLFFLLDNDLGLYNHVLNNLNNN
jgi:hypothetical protein